MSRPEAIILSDNPDVEFRPGFSMVLSPDDWEAYTHEIRDIGWYWQASFTLKRPEDELEEFFETGLNRSMEAYSSSGARIFEGFVNEMTFRRNAVEMRRTLRDMANRIWVRFSSPLGSGLRSNPVEDSVSIARYGVKEKPMSGGQLTGYSHADQIANVFLTALRWPENPSIQASARGDGETSLEIRVAGWWQKMYWRTFNDPEPGMDTRSLTNHVRRIFEVAEWPVSGVFERNDTQTQASADADMWAADALLNSARQGDANYDRWIVGIGPGRVPFFRRAAATRLPQSV